MPTVDDHLLAMQRRWTTRLSALLDMAIEEGCIADLPMVDLAASAWRRLAAEQPELRDELDAAARTSAALTAAMAVEHRMLALAAGLSTLDDPPMLAARVGQGYLRLVRESSLTDRPS